MSLKNKSILVTGGAGFIGSHLVDLLINEEPKEIIVVDNMSLGKERNLNEAKKRFPFLKLFEEDAGNFEVIGKIIKTYNIEIVFNLAVVPLPASLEKPKETTDENIKIVTALCELQRLNFFKTLIHFSSSEVYGSAKYESMNENHPLGSCTPYAASKAAGDLIVLSYCNTFNTDCAIIRPFNNYGPRQNEGSYAGVIPITIKKILKGEQPIIYGDGEQTRDYIYVTDTARMAIEIYNNTNTRGKIVNIGSGSEISVLKLINLIMNLLNNKQKIKFEPPRLGDVRRHNADISLAKKLLNFKPHTKFEEGMKITVDWYKSVIKNDKITK